MSLETWIKQFMPFLLIKDINEDENSDGTYWITEGVLLLQRNAWDTLLAREHQMYDGLSDNNLEEHEVSRKFGVVFDSPKIPSKDADVASVLAEGYICRLCHAHSGFDTEVENVKPHPSCCKACPYMRLMNAASALVAREYGQWDGYRSITDYFLDTNSNDKAAPWHILEALHTAGYLLRDLQRPFPKIKSVPVDLPEGEEPFPKK